MNRVLDIAGCGPEALSHLPEPAPSQAHLAKVEAHCAGSVKSAFVSALRPIILKVNAVAAGAVCACTLTARDMVDSNHSVMPQVWATTLKPCCFS